MADAELRLDGRVALITGASGTIGGAIAECLGGAGAAIALNARSTEALQVLESEIANRGASVASFAANLTDRRDLESLVPQVLAQFGRLDILVNCAGRVHRMDTLDVGTADYDEVLDLNLRAPFVLSQLVAPEMIRLGSGRIINIGSLTTVTGLAGITVYALSKAAMGQLTRQLAIEWAQYNILVNCVMPGFLRTKQTEEVWADSARRRWMERRIPLGRGGSGSDVARLVSFLASPASGYITGACIPVDGGIMAGMAGFDVGDRGDAKGAVRTQSRKPA
ncbi:MAG: glucose 1-dehydrogenase [Candidatus Dormiibacterota bacterium]